MKKYTILNSELLDALRTLPDNTFDGILCDPPYELGFMGKFWDSSGVAFQVETWKELLRVCKPGAGLLAFGGTRTYHRLACAIEDAGWELRDCLQWVYGSGFPKSMDVSKALDKAAGAEREVVGVKNVGNGNGRGEGFNHSGGQDGVSLTAPATDAARTWEGYGTALKPAYEPCLLARKPLDGTVAANVQRWGCGPLWIDGGRVGAGEDIPGGGPSYGKCQGVHEGWERPSHENYENKPGYNKGRWPANIIHDGSSEVLEGFPESKSGAMSCTSTSLGYHGNGNGAEFKCEASSGSAARFFYCAKASQKERNAGCEALPVQHLAQGNQAKAELARGNTEHGGNSGFNTVKAVRNTHPCVKPLDLCRYLATLILPPADRPHGPRKLLVPFSGSGSEMIGALMAGWEDVTGIEKDSEYIPIAQARLAHWTASPQEYFPDAPNELGQENKPWSNLPLLESTHA